ncbi:MAG TPA: hypothetical protein VHR41_18225 [Gemmatimonadales bacterium]|nr:hypothetical protein [Gemmatimonadales bacterium]
MRRVLLLVLLAGAPAAATGQSSQFGVRGLGLPGRSLSVHALGAGGAFGLFDPESSLNPAALAGSSALTATFSGMEDFRHVENPAGTASLRESRFPQMTVGGPLRRYPVSVGLGFSNYTSRDFTLATADTILLRDVLVPVSDTVTSRGGLSDLSIAGAYRLQEHWSVGGSFHVLTGTNRVTARRAFADTVYQESSQNSEISFAGVGVELGLMGSFSPSFAVAAIVRSDGRARIDRDSADVSRVDLPYTFGLGLRWQVRPRLALAGQGLFRTWSGANSDLLEQGGTGADNTIDLAFGGEYTPDPKRPSRRPLRLGIHYGSLPFPILVGEQPHELGVSIGSGLRFAQERAGIDLGLEHVWRSAGAYSERAFLVSVGVTVRP